MSMKCLFLTDYQLDYGLDSVLVGLYESMGLLRYGIDVYEYPIKENIHGQVSTGYDLPGQPGAGMTAPAGYLEKSPVPGPFFTKEEVFDIFPKFDFIFMGQRDYSRRAMKELCDAKGISVGSLDNVVLLEAEDYKHIDFDLINTYRPLFYAKRELSDKYSLAAYEGHYGVPIIPCPFGAFTRGVPDVDDEVKEWDVFVSLGQTHPIRNIVLGKLVNMVKVGLLQQEWTWIATNDNAEIYQQNQEYMKPLLPWAEYVETQAMSAIGISVRGFGSDTLHHWEMTSFATLCLYVHPGVYIPHPFLDREHCIYINQDLSNLESEIVLYLQDEPTRKKIAEAGKAHCRKYHTTRARAEYLVNLGMTIMGGGKVRWEEYGF